MKRILSKFSNFFKQKSQLEQFILSKNPMNSSDVDHWTRRYYEGEVRGL